MAVLLVYCFVCQPSVRLDAVNNKMVLDSDSTYIPVGCFEYYYILFFLKFWSLEYVPYLFEKHPECYNAENE